MQKHLYYRYGLMALVAALALAASATIIRAEGGTISTETAASLAAQESVVATSTDSSLERKAKLQRSWMLYNDGSTVWALTAPGATACLVPTATSTCDTTLIQKRAIKTLDFFTAFRSNFRILMVKPERMDRFTAGAEITSTDGLTPEMFIKRPYLTHRLIKSADSTAVYLDDGERLRPIVHERVFKNNGWDFKDVEVVSASEIINSDMGSAITAETVFEEDVEIEASAARKISQDIKSRLGERMLAHVKTAVIRVDGQYYLLTKQGKIAIPKIKEGLLSQRLGLDLSTAVEVTAEEAAAIQTVKTLHENESSAELNQSAD